LEIEGSAIYNTERQLYASIDTIPKDLQNAFVAIEDKRFYDHKGVDWYRTAGAVLNYIFKFRDSFGASTITQQLVKNVTGKDEYQIERKIQEIFSAISLEKKMDKEEILELYLNVINLSQGCVGVRAGAETYFSKELSELTLTECVCLAAITNSPTYYDPI
jgi:penicillin-binding protein 1A